MSELSSLKQDDCPQKESQAAIPPPNSSAEGSIEETDKDEVKYLRGFKLFAVVGAVTLACFLSMLDNSILSTATPLITTQFHSLSDVGWYAGAFQLASASLQPLTGKLYTYFRVKHTFLVFIFVFELGSLICGVAPSSLALIIGRTVAGLGSSGIMNGGLTIIVSIVEMRKRPLYVGIITGFAQLGVVAGPLVGGGLTEHVTWRWCFYINLPIGAAGALLLFFIDVPELTPKEKFSLRLIRRTIPELDLPGFSLLAPASVMFLLALQFGSGRTHAWDSATIIGLFCGAGLTTILFCAWEYKRGDRAMIPWALIKQRTVWASCLYGACLMSMLLGAAFYLPIYFQTVKGVSPTMSGVYVLPSILSQVLLAVVSGGAVSKMGYYLPWAVVSTFGMAVGNGLISTFEPGTEIGKWIGYQIIVGSGRGAGLQMPMIAVQTLLPATQIPISLALLIFSNNLFGAIAVVICTTIFTQSLASNLEKYAPSVPVQAALDAGGSPDAIRALVPEGSEELGSVLTAVSESVNNVFYYLVGLSCLAFAFSWGLGWGNVRKKEGEAKVEAEKQDEKMDAEKLKGSDRSV
ncbi:efflux pump protein [Lojkania enalia]|uniref:Efflux pump protein n=1 Tax=Lojkania enalia TaxID=147567 RepID=A0A9P4K040_9PLEO|nr:efflux pump protein [Didymosphaeria enalia]